MDKLLFCLEIYIYLILMILLEVLNISCPESGRLDVSILSIIAVVVSIILGETVVRKALIELKEWLKK